jgi:(1->4)-alpha-D-glucan 1-alpha-D-glucosylmutase
MNTKHRKQIDGNAVPDRKEEIFLYQTLLGAWPLDHSNLSALSKRMKEYAIKATREAMVHTRWTRPNLSHEAALEDFLTAILRSGSKNEFLRDFAPFQERIAYFGMINGLSQTLLKVFSPGIPDFYQGSELWDLRLVDPDNRRAVDYDARKTLLAKLPLIGDVPSTFLADLMHNWKDGGVKLYSLSKALRVRRDHPALFSDGSFMELEVVGKRRRHVSSFIRKHNEKWALIVVPRWLARAEYPADVTQVRSFWSNTEVRLPTGAPSSFKNVFSGEYVDAARTTARSKSIRIGNLLDKFPVALLIGATTPSSTLKRK